MSVPVLLLDATWRIDRVIGVNQACTLLVTGEAIAASEDIAFVMHSPSTTVEVPSVIARTTAISQRRHRPPACNPRRVRLRDSHVCQFIIDGRACEAKGDTVDHLVPASWGGENGWLNLVAACKAHNNTKADRSFEQMHDRFGWQLRRSPYAPTFAQMQAVSIRHLVPAWEPFLTAA
jgi:5-methylcytosine-specific restriction endonuclease McrA